MRANSKLILGGLVILVLGAAVGAALLYLMPVLGTKPPTFAPNDAPFATQPSAPAAVAAIPPAPTRDPAVLAKQLAGAEPGARDQAVSELHDWANREPRTLGTGLSQWGAPLLDDGYCDDAKILAETVVQERAQDPAVFEVALKYWVQACIRQSMTQTLSEPKAAYWGETLQLAKSYYNGAALPETADAANLLAEVLVRAKDPAAGREFLMEQAPSQASGEGLGPTSQPSELYKSINATSTHFQSEIDHLKSRVGPDGPSYASLISQGDYYLFDDDPENARSCFEAACRVAGSKSKQMRDALEGIARSMRAHDGNVSHANAFIEAMRNEPASVGAGLMDDGPNSPEAADLKSAAMGIKLADMSKLDAKPASP